MNGEERRALAALRFNYAEVADDVWRRSEFHVDGLHRATVQALVDGMTEAGESVTASPIGVVVQGQRGSGKTHLVGWVRERIQQEGGYFFLVSLLDTRDFWDSVLVSMLDSLARDLDADNQLRSFLRQLSSRVGMPRVDRLQLFGHAPLTRPILDAFIDALRRFDDRVGRDTQDTARALVLLASDDFHAQDVGTSYLSSQPEEEPGERADWGIRESKKSPQEIVKDVFRLLAVIGPSVIAVDQVDALIAQSSIATKAAAEYDWRNALVIEQIAGGLMSLRENTSRTLTVLSCLPASWALIKTVAVDSVRDRFRESIPLQSVPSAKIGRDLIEKRLAKRYRAIGFRPPYPTWPVKESAFENAPDFTVRQLLIKIDEHVRNCLVGDEIRELEHLTGESGPVADRTVPVIDTSALEALDARFAALKDAAETGPALDPRSEDAVMPALLSAGLAAWIAGYGDAGRELGQDAPPSGKPSLHARLRRSLDESTEDEAHWAFRAIAAGHPIAVLNRLRAASVAAGLNSGASRRRLFVLRNDEWSGGPRTREAVAEFERLGGRVLPVGTEDLRTLAALKALMAENAPELPTWLVARKPAAEVRLLNEALSDVWTVPEAGVEEAESAGVTGGADVDAVETDGQVPVKPVKRGGLGPGGAAALNAVRGLDIVGGGSVTGNEEEAAGEGAPAVTRVTETVGRDGLSDEAVETLVVQAGEAGEGSEEARAVHFEEVAGRAVTETAITVGKGLSDEAVIVELEALRKHTVIFAGSGSGKTVLIRRVVEECALRGVSAIVLDPNNDLARLGDAWPENPPQWGPGDAGKAKEYLDATDVVVWTPGRDAGRPLTFQPLPDFTGVVDDPDEFREAVGTAVESLAPRARLTGNNTRAHRGMAVLREALTYYARRGRVTLKGFTEVLAALPEGVSELRDAQKLAADIAENLHAATVNDPLFGGEGTPVDPGVLLTPAAGKRARVSVINLAGLPSDGQRQGFVNQLQMALFSWIKRNPAGDRPLGGLFVMDEAQTFAPSGAMTACTHSTLALASQARKYGLGLVFATQSPRGLHNRIPGNAATQFFGLLNAPVQIEAAKELARAKGGAVADVAHLGAGEFYAALEGGGFRKVRTSLCLSHHPKSALTTDEVIARARRPLER
ncbi:hypothetical protein Ssi03_59980 [Sphaerisporangium siamense]|uniref:DNA helicase HerA-like ATPase n=1 Tax=Sphaerisporangium siamense TaxID=795645 RepID=A0A7W7DAW6_9ACTN|nr:DUF87 domain-containing protein [Sphaerisporangium siamense]MBB4703231.1 DNA helicase HerA-like ATPase [Sphaerisporangium siamense]GII88008.1 hypothetical protein Ssi03_59980 [Sphaerisporangium siamense]